MSNETTFAQAMTELESVVRDLESGTLELEESLVRYERGVALIRELSGKLDAASQKVTTMLGDITPQLDEE